jgi:Lon protease-like protein
VDLRLFPLSQVVLFPGMILPLQVFEPRYRQLVAECLQDSEPFGVVLIREGVEVGGPAVPHEVGTTARIRSASLGIDGMLHIEAVGERRFRVLELHDDRAYLWADVEYPIDAATDVPLAVVEEAREGLLRMQRLRATAAGEFERAPAVPEDPGAVADAVASLVTAPTEEMQRVLETFDPHARLQAALPRLEELLSETERIAEGAAALRWRGFGRAN